MRIVFYAAVAGAVLGIPGPALWYLNYVFGHHYVADGSGVLERLLPFFPAFPLLMMIPDSDPAAPSTYLGAMGIVLLANMVVVAVLAALVAALVVGVWHLVGLTTG
jgi:hypothetical protein